MDYMTSRNSSECLCEHSPENICVEFPNANNANTNCMVILMICMLTFAFNYLSTKRKCVSSEMS